MDTEPTMAEPIRNNKPDVAPTPQNTPASVSALLSQTPLSRNRPGLGSISEGADLGNVSQLIDVIQNRLGGLDGLKSNYIELLPKQVKDRVAAMKGIRARQAQIEGEYHRELLELDKKYQKKLQPLYDERRALISGEAEPKSDDITQGEAAFEEEKLLFDGEDEEDDEDKDEDEDDNEEESKDAEDENEDEPESNVVGVPAFWLTAFSNVPHLSEMIHERDSEVLNYLVDVRLRYTEKPGFALDFEFKENPFFTNKVLTKTYYYQEEIGLSGDFMFSNAEGSEIKWTSTANNVTVRVEKRKQRNKHTKATRTIEKTLPEESFFNFFTPPNVDDLEDNEEDEDEYTHSLQAALELDFELGEFFKEKLVPKAVDWFTGRAIDYEGLGAGEEEEDDEEYDEDDEEEDDDDEEGEPPVDSLEGMKKEVPENCKQQ